MTVYTSDHWVMPYCIVDRAALQMFTLSVNPLVRLITTTFAFVSLPECCVNFCIVVQHSYPNLLLR